MSMINYCQYLKGDLYKPISLNYAQLLKGKESKLTGAIMRLFCYEIVLFKYLIVLLMFYKWNLFCEHPIIKS